MLSKRSIAAFATTAVVASVAIGAGTMGIRAPWRLWICLYVGALATQRFPHKTPFIAVAAGTLALALLNPVFAAYFLVLIAGLTVTRTRPLPFVALLALGTIVYPKMAFLRHYHAPGYWNWLNEPSLALVLFVSALWWRSRRDRKPDATEADAQSFLLLYLFPTHAANPMAIGPSVLWRPLTIDWGNIVRLLGWFALKAGTLGALRSFGGVLLLRQHVAIDTNARSCAYLWCVVAGSYVETYLALAASADIPILIARLYGWNLPDPFRAPLLAWNPVELWRRWGIYNRQFLLRIVYFPLGGSDRRRYLNVALTFLASALILHSGWFGSKYWAVGTGGLRDELLYFSLQGLAVCGCLRVWQTRRQDPRADREFRLSAARAIGTVATQAWSAWVHVIILAQGMTLAERVHLMARCLGF